MLFTGKRGRACPDESLDESGGEVSWPAGRQAYEACPVFFTGERGRGNAVRLIIL